MGALSSPSRRLGGREKKGGKKVKTLRGEKVAPLFVFTVTRGEGGGGDGGGGRVRRAEFSVSLSLFFPLLPSSAPSVYQLPLFSHVTDVLKLFFVPPLETLKIIFREQKQQM